MIDEIIESFEHPASHRWCQLIELPAGVTDVAAAAAIDDARRQAGRAEPLVRLPSLTEGAAAQILSVGGHSEAHSIRDLYQFVVESGFRTRGDLHQIVLADADVVPRERARSVFPCRSSRCSVAGFPGPHHEEWMTSRSRCDRCSSGPSLVEGLRVDAAARAFAWPDVEPAFGRLGSSTCRTITGWPHEVRPLDPDRCQGGDRGGP